MYQFILRAVFITLGGILLSSPEKSNKPEGYRAIIRYEDGFLAAGSGGQVDWISVSGKITKIEKFPGEKLNCLLSYNQMIIVAGEKGSILISSNKGIFRKVSSGTDKNINSLASFKGIIIGGADNGEIISGDGSGPFKKIHLELKGNIVSVSSRASDCYGVTDAGEIIHSIDAIHWKITDFNKVYAGYYKMCYFRKVLVTENRMAIAGVNIDNSPVILFSTQGNVWTDRPLIYSDEQSMKVFLEDLPNDIVYDEERDNFFVACTKGKLMKLPSCSQCNEVAVISTEDLEGISFNGNSMMIVGGNFFIKAVNIGW